MGQVTVTIGNDPGTAQAIESMGVIHKDCPVHEAVVDEAHKVVTSPAYMLAQSIKDVNASAEALVNGILKLL